MTPLSLRSVTTAVLLCAGTATAWAGGSQAPTSQVSLKDGRVTIVADGVPARKILEDWARVGQIRITNLDKLTGPPVTLRLVDVSERDALDVLLRQAAGYLAAPRLVSLPGASRFDRILILATSRPPASSGAAVPAAGPAPQPFAPPAIPDEQSDQEEGADPTPPPGMTAPPAGFGGQMPPLLQPNPAPFPGTGAFEPQPSQTTPVVTLPRPGVVPAPSAPGTQPSATPGGFLPTPGMTPAPTTPAGQTPPKKPGGGGGF